MSVKSHYLKVLVVTMVVFLLAGCALAHPQVERAKGPKGGLIFGYVDLKPVHQYIGQATLLEDKRGGIAYRTSYMYHDHDGLIYAYNLAPDKYSVMTFQGDSPGWHFDSTGIYDYQFINSKKDLVDIKPGQMVFVGAYRVKVTSSKLRLFLMNSGNYDLVPVKSPTELQLLERMHAEMSDPYWKGRIEQEIHYLKSKQHHA